MPARKPLKGPLALSVERMVDSMGDQLTGDEAPHIEGLHQLARMLDEGGDDRLWREFRMLLKDLRLVVAAGGDVDDKFQALVERLAQVGDS